MEDEYTPKRHVYKMDFNEVRQMQAIPYEIKIQKSKNRLDEFISHYGEGGVALCFSGGLDSTFGLSFIRKYYKNVKAISVAGIECKENIDIIRKTDNVQVAKLQYTQDEIIKCYGVPVVSKKAAKALRRLQNPTEKNKRSRNLALTGITSAGNTANSYKLAKKWRFLIDAPFKISEKCCYYMKETVLERSTKKQGLSAIVVTLAEESKERMAGYCRRGTCNTFGELGYSTPFAFWTRQDVLRYIVENNIEISKAYGEIQIDENGQYYTTKAQRTGCPICMFGMDKDGTPNRFQIMYYDDFRNWKRAMFEFDYMNVFDYFIKNGFVKYQYFPQEILERIENGTIDKGILIENLKEKGRNEPIIFTTEQ